MNRRTIFAAAPFTFPTRRVLWFVVAIALTALPGEALHAEVPADAGHFVSGLTDDVIHRIIEPKVDERERSDRFRALLSRTLATETIGRFVLGRFWITSTRSERASFLEIFSEVMAVRFMPLLKAYSGERVEIGTVRSDPGQPTLFTVASRLVQPHGTPVNVIWRVRRDGRTFRVVDVVAEGVSMAIMLRSEYRSYISRHGGRVAGLIAALRERVASDAAATAPVRP